MKTIKKSFFYLPIFLVLFCCKNNSDFYFVTKYGAKGDSTFLNTKYIQKAIDAANKAGGGTVIVPPGIYISGSIFLKDNVTFEVQEGAKIIGSSRIEDYTEMTWGHNRDRQPYHLLIANEAKNVTIQGGGIIDGNGQAFWQDWNEDSLPKWIMAKELKVSPMMEIRECKNVRIKDVTIKTGGGWTLHLYNSSHVQVQGIKILNNVYSPNGDGIDISGSEDVTISDCIIKTCDDAICLKTMVDTRECKRVVVTNCVIECLCAALKIGNESFRDISQVTFSNCVIYGSSRAIGIYAESAGTVSDIVISNIVCDSKVPLIFNRPIHISLYHAPKGSGSRNGDWMFKEEKQWDYEGKEPQIKNVIISNFICKTEGRILIAAENGRYIENLTLRDIKMNYAWIEDPTINVEKVKSSQFSPTNPEAKKAKAAMVLENIKNLTLDGFTITWPDSLTVPNDWKFVKRIANGTKEAFYLDYSKARQTELSAVWGRELQGGYIFAPMANASDKSMPTYDIKNSTIKIRD